MAEWRERAACLGLDPAMFLEAVYPEYPKQQRYGDPDPEALEKAVSVCAECPVRLACFQEAMRDETQPDGQGFQAMFRFGIRGGTTPPQRYSIHKRRAAECFQCGEAYDPLGIVAGEMVCECGFYEEAPIPVAGDQWFARHDELLRRLVTWVLQNSEPGDRIPPPYRMMETLGYRRKDDMPIVYEKLIEDGLLERGAGRGVYLRREGKRAWASWRPPARRRVA